VTLTGDDVMPYKAGDSLGLTWYNTGNIPFDYANAQNYCEDSVVVGAVGSTMSLVADRYGGREYSLTASFCKYISSYNKLLEKVLFVKMTCNNCVSYIC
jgi:hypothetical protein